MFAGRLNDILFALTAINVFLSINVQAKYLDECMTAAGAKGKCMPHDSCFHNFTGQELEASQASCKDSGNEKAYVCCSAPAHLNFEGIDLLKEYQECGPYEEPKMAHGQKCELFNFRWMALLKYNDGDKPFRCAGSLISKRYVLTAAHCVPKDPKSLVAVRLGEYDLSTENDCVTKRRFRKCLGPYEEIGIEKHIVHESYTYPIQNDIALLRLDRDVEFKKHIQPVCLPINSKVFEERADHYRIAGWGITEQQTESNVLLEIFAPVQNRDYCERRLKIATYGPLTLGHICVGGEDYADACKGDSGGSLVHLSRNYDETEVRAIQYGIVSAGARPCGTTNDPGIYTNILYHMQWITDHMRA